MSDEPKKISYKSAKAEWEIYPDVCKSCGLCIVKCPVKSLSFDEENNEYLGMPTVKNNIEKCIACGTCQMVCPDCAIFVEKKK